MPQQILEVDVDSVIFCYQLGITYTAIWTKQKDQHKEEVPNHFKMSFGFSTPDNFYGSGQVLREDQIADVIRAKIREKAECQRRSGSYVPMKTTQRIKKSR